MLEDPPSVRVPASTVDNCSHPLLQECSWGIKQGLGIVTCNTEDLVVTGLVCVFLEVLLTALYFRVTYCPHVQNLCCIQACALCS